ncbi:MAG: SDR family NAD(P)-dependent oxidoreductase [Lautropia sp.]|nr:SDR family NAD(P)-dependent oxidoreductase [Lautropia sp.]
MTPSGHTALITGGATGIGFALARQFHQAGNKVIIIGRRSDALDEAARQLPGIQTEQADITKAEDRERLVRQHADIDILVNNAGIQINRLLRDLSEAEITTELDINLHAPVLFTHAFLPRLLERPEAAIVNVSSGLALVPKQSAAIYCATKAALHSFSKTLRWQLEDTPVRVFELMPPLVDTAMTAGRGTGKISADALATEFWHAFLQDRFEIRAGKTRLLSIINRLAPSVAERIMRRGL